MSLSSMKTKGIPLPDVETVEGLTAQDIHDSITSFLRRYEEYDGQSAEFVEGYFLELLRDYPVSMCCRNMTGTLKRLVALFYFSTKQETDTTDAEAWNGYSYEDLAVIFDRSKATIHEAIRQEETHVRQLLIDSRLRKEAKAQALQSMVEEEKQKLQETNQNIRPDERTSPIHSVEDVHA